MSSNDDILIWEAFILSEAKDIIKSNDPKELLAKTITGTMLYSSDDDARTKADQIANDILTQISNIQKEKNKTLFSDKDILALVISILMSSGTQPYLNSINNDKSNINYNLYNRSLPIILHDYKDALDNSEALLSDAQFSTLFQKGIPKWLDIVHSIQGKEKHKPQEIVSKTKQHESLFENEEVIVYLANDTENPINSIQRCKFFGKGSNLCISGSNASYHYMDYRWNDKLTTYFCYLKTRNHYMLVDVTEDGNFQYNPVFDENGNSKNIDIETTKEKLLRLYPELNQAFQKNIFVSVPIEGRELMFFEKFYDINSIKEVSTPEDRLIYASFNDITPNDWNDIPQEEHGKILEKAIYTTTEYDIPDNILEKYPRLKKQYMDNVFRRVSIEVEEWNSEDKLEFTLNELNALKDIDTISENFLKLHQNDMWFITIFKDDPKYNKDFKNIIKKWLDNISHKTDEKGNVIFTDNIILNDKVLMFPFKLIECENIYARSATTISLPQLQTSGNISAGSATTISLPQLQTSGDIDARSATTISLPQLQTSGDIDARSATTISLPQLQKTSRDISANSATTISLPQLQTSEFIYAGSATTISLPQLQTSRDIYADSATTISLPQLQTSEFIYAGSATTISLPQLQTSEFIYAGSAKKIIISKKLKNRIRHTDIEITEPSETQENLNDSYIYDLMKSFLLRS